MRVHEDALESLAGRIGVDLSDDGYGVPERLARLDQLVHEIGHAIVLQIPLRWDGVKLKDRVTVALAMLDLPLQHRHELMVCAGVVKLLERLGERVDRERYFRATGINREAWDGIGNKGPTALANALEGILRREGVISE